MSPQRTVIPFIRWDLSLHPRALNDAYWQESADKLRTSDQQVALCLLLAVAIMVVSGPHQLGWQPLLVCATVLCWMLLLHSPALYTRHRLWIISGVRVLLWYPSMHALSWPQVATNQARVPLETSSFPLLLAQLMQLSSTAHIPLTAVRLPMPFLLQLLLTVAHSVLLLFSGVFKELAAYAVDADAQGAVADLVALWATLLQSGKYIPIADNVRLAGRSSAMLVCLATMYLTTVAITLYTCYFALWGDQRWWLSGHGSRIAARGAAGRQLGRVAINGCTIQEGHLQAMCCSPAALLLFNRRGIRGRLSRACIHFSLLNLICLGCLVVSQTLVQKILPRLLTERILIDHYPLTGQ